MTLDCAEVSLSRVFECGQAYVALSRIRSLKGVRIVDFDENAIRANETVLKYYQRLKDGKSYKQKRLIYDENDDDIKEN